MMWTAREPGSARTLSDGEWAAFERRSPPPTFFARRAWLNACAHELSGAQAQAIEIDLPGSPAMVPLLRLRSRFGFRVLDAAPFFGYGCVLESDGTPAPPERAKIALETLAAGADSLSYTSWPACEAPLLQSPSVAHETSIIDLRIGFEAVMRGMKGVTRRMAGQADRRGVQCAIEAPDRALDLYYGLLDLSAKRWGIEAPTISRSFLEAVVRQGGDDVEIWIARAGGEPAGGGVVLYGAREVFFWTAAMDAKFSEMRPSNALNVALIQRACERGLDFYNMGASKGLEGVARFKRSLGAKEYRYDTFELVSGRYAAYLRLREFGSRLSGGGVAVAPIVSEAP